MLRIIKWTGTLLLLLSLLWCGGLLADKQSLRENVIRLHVVANSNTEEDQLQKLIVRDAVLDYLQDAMEGLSDPDEVKQYLQSQLSKIEEIANNALQSTVSVNCADVSFGTEAFDTREYDTFQLPSGIYESLKISIGDGKGENWWCVIFPSLCVPDTVEAFCDTAAASGIGDSLINSLAGKEEYETRFFFLECLGRIEKFFFRD